MEIHLLQAFYNASVIINVFMSVIVMFFSVCSVGRRIDPSWGGPIELFLVPASAPRLV